MALIDVETDDGRQKRLNQQEAEETALRMRGLRPRIARYQRSPLPLVRRRAEQLLATIDRQLSSQNGPDRTIADGLDHDAQDLEHTAEEQAARLAAMQQLDSLKANAEARTKEGLPARFQTRLSELRTEYNSVAAPPVARTPSDKIGPSFDCGKTGSPLGRLVCANAALRFLDVDLQRPYYALRHLQADKHDALKAEFLNLQRRAVTDCHVHDPEESSLNAVRRASQCVLALYRRQRDAWTDRVKRDGPASAREELERPLRDHIRLQGELKAAGFLSPEAAEDGVYGGSTRNAIIALQGAEQLPPDGFMSNIAKDRLRRRVTPNGGDRITSNSPAKIAALVEAYKEYVSEVDAYDRNQAAIASRLAELRRKQAIAERLLLKPIPTDLREFLSGFVDRVRGADKVAPAALSKLDADFAVWRSRVEATDQTVESVKPQSEFLLQGDAGDLVFLYNSSPQAPTVAKDLKGSLTFDQRGTRVCFIGEPVTDRFVVHLMEDKAQALGLPLRLPISQCALDSIRNYDAIVLQRGYLLKRPPGSFAVLASTTDEGTYAKLDVLATTDIKAARAAEAAKAIEVEAAVHRGAPSGFAILAVDNGSSVVCTVIPSEREAHERIIQGLQTRLADELNGIPRNVPMSVDGAFLALKRSQCGAIYASAGDLDTLSRALERDHLKFRYLPFWITSQEIEREAAEVLAQRRNELQDELGRFRSTAQAMLKDKVAGDIRSFLEDFDVKVGPLLESSTADLSALETLKAGFERMQPRLAEAEALSRATTPRNSFLLEGARDDVIFLYNDSGKAPSVVRNIRGELVFDERKAHACVYHDPIGDVFLNRQIRETVKALGAKLVSPLRSCSPDSLLGYDIVVLERGRLLREPLNRVAALMELVDRGTYAPLADLQASELSNRRQVEAAQANQAEADVRSGQVGFGVVVIENGSSVVCNTATSDADAHAAILARFQDRIRDDLPSTPSVVPTSIEAVFISAKRSECGAVYGASEGLAALVQALERDHIRFHFVPVWINAEDVEEAKAKIKQDLVLAATAAAVQRQKIEDAKKLAAANASEYAALRAAQEGKLREQYGAMARAFAQVLAKEIKDYVEARPSPFARKYPSLARAVSSLYADHWELMFVETKLEDYGTAEYKGRSLESAFARSTIKMRNRILGEYKDLCFLTGFINDSEFGMEREPIGVQCSDGDKAIQEYEDGQRFSSLWIVR